MRFRFVALAALFTLTAIVAAACDDAGDNDSDVTDAFSPTPTQVTVTPTPEEDTEGGLTPLGFVSVTLTSEATVVDPQQVDYGSLSLNMSNETDELRSVRVRVHDEVEEFLERVHGDEEGLLEFGVAPGETRWEYVDTDHQGPLKVYWADDILHVERVDAPPPTPPPALDACPTAEDARTGYTHGYRDGLVMEWELESGELLEGYYLGEYSRGYEDGYTAGLASGHFGRPKEIGEDLRDYVVAYARGYEDGHDDGYSLATSSLFSQEYREHYFHGFFDAILDEANLCGS